MKEKSDNGGLKILLSVVAFLFLIGLVIFIFALFGGAFSDTTAINEVGSVANESLLFTNGTGTDTSVADLKDVQLSNVVVEGCV